MTKQSKITLVKFRGYVDHNLLNETPVITKLRIPAMPSLDGCMYEGVRTRLSKPLSNFMINCKKLTRALDNRNNNGYTTICVIVDDTVLFLDLCGSSDNTEHPDLTLQKVNIIRDKLNNIFAKELNPFLRLFYSRKLKYLPQSDQWYSKQIIYVKNDEEMMKEYALCKKNVEIMNRIADCKNCEEFMKFVNELLHK